MSESVTQSVSQSVSQSVREISRETESESGSEGFFSLVLHLDPMTAKFAPLQNGHIFTLSSNRKNFANASLSGLESGPTVNSTPPYTAYYFAKPVTDGMAADHTI